MAGRAKRDGFVSDLFCEIHVIVCMVKRCMTHTTLRSRIRIISDNFRACGAMSCQMTRTEREVLVMVMVMAGVGCLQSPQQFEARRFVLTPIKESGLPTKESPRESWRHRTHRGRVSFGRARERCA